MFWSFEYPRKTPVMEEKNCPMLWTIGQEVLLELREDTVLAVLSLLVGCRNILVQHQF